MIKSTITYVECVSSVFVTLPRTSVLPLNVMLPYIPIMSNYVVTVIFFPDKDHVLYSSRPMHDININFGSDNLTFRSVFYHISLL